MLAKWIAGKHQAKVIFDGQAVGASSNVKTNEIFMPSDLKEHNILSALALLMHEAGHLKHSGAIPKDVANNRVISHNILNAFEDIRIDNKNFNILYNIKDFYQKLIQDHVYPRKEELKKEHLMTRCLINGILENEGFYPIDDEEAQKMNRTHNFPQLMQQAQRDIDCGNWEEVKKAIKKVKDIFKIEEKDDIQMPKQQMVGMAEGKGEATGGEGRAGEKTEKNGTPGIDGTDIGNTDKFLRPASAWDKGAGIKGPSRDIVGEAAFQDITRDAFKELLAIKEKRMVYEGTKLNTESITSFFTGDIDELFHDEDIQKVKKSKIAFCLDASGSMRSKMLDGSDRQRLVVKTTRSIISILNEIQEQEGLNISYDIWSFDTSVEKMSNEGWEKEYTAHGGGTDLHLAFTTVQADILNNQEIDGNKLIILLTDGEVSSDEIESLRQQILKHGAEVRCMVVGVGANLTGTFVTTIAGESNIIGEEHADSIIMDTIKMMLE